MAKLSMPINTQNDPEVDVVAEDIASALARLSWLLEGRIDYDNIAKIIDGSEERPLQIPASKIQDIPLISNEINCDKFFRDEVGTYGTTGLSNKFSTLVWSPLKNAVINNPVFTSLEGTLSISITKDTPLYNGTSTSNRKNSEGELIGDVKVAFSNRVEVEIPPTLVPVKYKRFCDTMGVDFDIISDNSDNEIGLSDYVVEYSIYVDSYRKTQVGSPPQYFASSSGLNKPTYSALTGTISVDIKPVLLGTDSELLDEEDFVNISITMYVLCEERI